MDVTEQEAIMEIVTSWTEQGIQQGEVALVMRLLTHRFGQTRQS